MEQEQNRTEQATPFKKSEARKRGQVARSLDFNTMLAVTGLLLAALIAGEHAWRTLTQACRELLGRADAVPDASLVLIAESGAAAVLPFFVVAIVCGILGNLLQNGIVLSTEPLKPKWDRLSPVAGFKRVFNKRMLMEAAKSVLKLALLASAAGALFRAIWPGLPALASLESAEQVQSLGHLVVQLLWRLAAVLIVIGLLDLAWVRWQFGRQMMMSRREVREEVKRREGDPLIRAKLRELQRENLKQARSVSRVREADVLITNPSHVAIALCYVRGEMAAPTVLAKGRDAWAERLKSEARRHGVPLVEHRRLARDLLRLAVVDQPIPAETYVEVARVFASLEGWSATGRARPAQVEVRA